MTYDSATWGAFALVLTAVPFLRHYRDAPDVPTPSLSLRAVFAGIWVSPRANPDFAWAFGGRLLVNLAREPKWAIDSLKAAIAQDPEDAYAHYLLGAAYWNSGSPAQSESDYLAAMNGADTRRDALHELTRAMLDAHKVTKARKYVDLLNKEYPKFAPGWMTRGSVLLGQGINGDEVTRALRKFAATADPNDFRQMQDLQRVRAMLKTIDKAAAASTR